jgi:Proprotein convertase P-domain
MFGHLSWALGEVFGTCSEIIIKRTDYMCFSCCVCTVMTMEFCFCRCRTLEKRGASFQVAIDGCRGTKNEINFLEHVQAKVTLSYSKRGDLQLYLQSPSGTKSTLLPRRKNDFQAGKLDAWPFLSVFYWGEQPNGTWTLTAENVGALMNTGN